MLRKEDGLAENEIFYLQGGHCVPSHRRFQRPARHHIYITVNVRLHFVCHRSLGAISSIGNNTTLSTAATPGGYQRDDVSDTYKLIQAVDIELGWAKGIVLVL